MIELLRQRRSIRKYKDKKVEPEKIEILKEALLRSPSSRNINPWEFIFIEDTNMLRLLSKAKRRHASFLAQAALGIVVCGNSNESDTWIEDCSIASIIVQLAVHSIGLGSCWIQIRNRNYNNETSSESYIQKQLCIPEHIRIESIIAVGYPAEILKVVPKGELDYGKIKWEKY